MKRSRGRGRRQQNPVNRSYDSNGPDVRVRGTASQVYEKYQALARDAMSSGDRVMAENYQQHAEHYFRILQSFQPAPSEGEREGDGETNIGDAQEADANGAENGADKAANGEDAVAATGGAEPLILVRDNDAEEDAKPATKSRRRGPLGKKRGGKPTGEDSAASNAEAARAGDESAEGAPLSGE